MLIINCKRKGTIDNSECYECFSAKMCREYKTRVLCKKENVLEQFHSEENGQLTCMGHEQHSRVG